MILLLGACGKSAEEKTYAHLEEAVSIESSFQEQQDPLRKLEEKEESLYEKMLTLDSEETDKIQKHSKQAVELANEREDLLNKEKESIEAAYEEYKKAVEDMKDVEGAAKEVKAVQQAMDDRYGAYQSLHETYLTAIKKDVQLYKSLTKENLTLETLKKKIDAVNDTYADVAKQSEKFNRFTDQYNEAKTALYEKAGFELKSSGTEKTDDKNKSTETEEKKE
nr:YkyA family protein [Bacillus piscicola]